eukprot:NODE_83_length_22684_cov_0.307934.p9 type:complete len:187 gc:universal NODE_83_length_22684_cov_0.307934:10097-10657(+)
MNALMIVLMTISKAHVTANPNYGAPKAYLATYFRIGHSCSPLEKTTSVEIEIPDGVYTVRPKYTAGWTFNVTTVQLETPITGGETPITSKVTKVTFNSAEGLANDAYEDLGLNFQLPDKAGTNLFFKTTQKCPGNTTAWVNIPENNDIAKWGKTAKPAPYVMIKAETVPEASTQDPVNLGIAVAGN